MTSSYAEGSERVLYGNYIQELVVKFLEENLEYTWVAGERNSKVMNEKEFSFLKGFSRIETTKQKGRCLVFRNISDEGFENDSYILLPDELFIKNNIKEFIEVKGRNIDKSKNKYFTVKKFNMDSYSELKRIHRVPVWIIFCLETNSGFNLFFADVDDAIELAKDVPFQEIIGYDEYGSPCYKNVRYYKWDSSKGFRKLNEEIIPLNYLDL